MERHVCCRIDRERLTTPTIDPHEVDDPTLRDLLAAFEREGIHIMLKDFSLGMPLPTVGAVAWDPATFPARSEIVFTAGTAASPAKAAIRAVTEIAQLGGDFCTQACYEASGLSKFERLEDIRWLLEGPRLPSVRPAQRGSARHSRRAAPGAAWSGAGAGLRRGNHPPRTGGPGPLLHRSGPRLPRT